MKGLRLALVPLAAAVVLGAGAPAGTPAKKKPSTTPTPSATPNLEDDIRLDPTPTPEPARFLVSVESSQGEGGERIALFADGTLVRTTRWRGRSVTKRLTVTREELEVIRRILADALASTDQEPPRSDVLASGTERSRRLEIGNAEGPSRVFAFDDVTSLPLAAGRARGAIEDLGARFDSATPIGEAGWDASDLAIGDRLRNRTDGRWWVVTRDDSFERNIEFRCEEGGYVIWVERAKVPRAFYDPSQPSPEPAPTREAAP